jgi:hypothetical protein
MKLIGSRRSTVSSTVKKVGPDIELDSREISAQSTVMNDEAARPSVAAS